MNFDTLHILGWTLLLAGVLSHPAIAASGLALLAALYIWAFLRVITG
ncbi:hypothetical protein [Arenimonas sp.]|nr:hypothetical protein [Arenimonas sp.]